MVAKVVRCNSFSMRFQSRKTWAGFNQFRNWFFIGQYNKKWAWVLDIFPQTYHIPYQKWSTVYKFSTFIPAIKGWQYIYFIEAFATIRRKVQRPHELKRSCSTSNIASFWACPPVSSCNVYGKYTRFKFSKNIRRLMLKVDLIG